MEHLATVLVNWCLIKLVPKAMICTLHHILNESNYKPFIIQHHEASLRTMFEPYDLGQLTFLTTIYLIIDDLNLS